MKFYLDFEATQFSNRIISIGCISETGEKFSTLVKPVKGAKISNFITQLTGITNEMIAEAPSAEEAFNSFREWIKEHNTDNLPPQFYVYGNDADYISHTVPYMKDFDAVMTAAAIKGQMIDYSKEVCSHLRRSSVSLRSLVALVKAEDTVVQHHDALEDAEWLKLVAENLDKIPSNVTPPKIPKAKIDSSDTFVTSEEPFPEISFVPLSKEPDSVHSWKNGKNWMWKNVEGNQLGTEEDWIVRAWNNNADNHEVFFRNPIDAIYWSLKSRGVSIKKMSNRQSTWAQICSAAKKGTKFGSVYWEIKSVKQEEVK